MKLPLHIKPSDTSEEANMDRMVHFQNMANLNPAGFRQPGKKPMLSRQERLAGQRPEPEESERGKKKRQRRRKHQADVLIDQRAGLESRKVRKELREGTIDMRAAA